MIHVVIPGEPVAQPRRWSVPGKKKDGTAYVKNISAPGKHPIHQWRDRIRYEVVKALDGSGIAQIHYPIVGALFVFPRTGALRKRGPNPTRGGGRPDLDNLLKPLQDVVNEIGLWKDDRRVFHVAGLSKREASGDNPADTPRAEFRIWEATEFNLEQWVQWCIDTWPVEWSGRSPIVKE